MYVIPDVLRAAADLIDQGWSRGMDAADTPEGGVAYCANGAIKKATGREFNDLVGLRGRRYFGYGTPEQDRALDLTHGALNEYLTDTLGMSIPANSAGIIRFNDQLPHANGGPVAKVLRDCADWIESHPERVLTGVIRENAEPSYNYVHPVKVLEAA